MSKRLLYDLNINGNEVELRSIGVANNDIWVIAKFDTNDIAYARARLLKEVANFMESMGYNAYRDGAKYTGRIEVKNDKVYLLAGE